MQYKNKLPYNASGYFSTVAMADLDMEQNIARRQESFNKMLIDMGLRRQNGQIVPDWSNPYGALAEGSRAARDGALDRGFSSRGAMRQIAFAPVKSEVFKQTERARQDMINENARDRNRKNQIYINAARDAAYYGYQNKQPKEKR